MIPILNSNKGLNERLQTEPRLSKAQRDALADIAATDPQAQVVGLDEKMRPVVHAKLPGPGSDTKFALLRNGEPRKVAQPLVEEWR